MFAFPVRLFLHTVISGYYMLEPCLLLLLLRLKRLNLHGVKPSGCFRHTPDVGPSVLQQTPVWRAGPHGPKTLCNACGVRYMKYGKRSK